MQIIKLKIIAPLIFGIGVCGTIVCKFFTDEAFNIMVKHHCEIYAYIFAIIINLFFLLSHANSHKKSKELNKITAIP